MYWKQITPMARPRLYHKPSAEPWLRAMLRRKIFNRLAYYRQKGNTEQYLEAMRTSMIVIPQGTAGTRNDPPFDFAAKMTMAMMMTMTRAHDRVPQLEH